MFQVLHVSIPHRYGKNVDFEVLKLTTVRKFPFLIGTVRTKLFLSHFLFPLSLFPFLIGTVRTQTSDYLASVTVLVSIPHRYGKN